MKTAELDERKREILRLVVESYISTGEPIGSRTISKLDSLNLSPATIRNEMADLEEMGFLEQPHISAGRIPSDAGYRYYVENIMPKPIVPRDEMSQIMALIEQKSEEINRLVREIADLYIRMISYTFRSLPMGLGEEIIRPAVSEQILVRGMSQFFSSPGHNEVQKAHRILDFVMRQHEPMEDADG